MHSTGNGRGTQFVIWWIVLAVIGLLALALIVAFLPAGFLAITLVIVGIIIAYLFYAVRGRQPPSGYRE